MTLLVILPVVSSLGQYLHLELEHGNLFMVVGEVLFPVEGLGMTPGFTLEETKRSLRFLFLLNPKTILCSKRCLVVFVLGKMGQFF